MAGPVAHQRAASGDMACLLCQDLQKPYTVLSILVSNAPGALPTRLLGTLHRYYAIGLGGNADYTAYSSVYEVCVCSYWSQHGSARSRLSLWLSDFVAGRILVVRLS